MGKKERLDKLLSRQGFFSSRSKAKRAIMAGQIYVNGEKVDKAGTQVNPDDDFEVRGDTNPYVSRGGLKLDKALEVFAVDPSGWEVIDVGASTGGFTDCLLQAGANKVFAIDVGHGQLAWKLRQDDRVEVFEKTNFRYFTPDDLAVTVPLVTIDVSFISLRLIIPPALEFLSVNGEIIALIKPQFEAGRDRVGQGGVVRDPEIHKDVLLEICKFFKQQNLQIIDLDYSPITGASSKNIEFLAHLKKAEVDDLGNNEPGEKNEITIEKKIKALVNRAHGELI